MGRCGEGYDAATTSRAIQAALSIRSATVTSTEARSTRLINMLVSGSENGEFQYLGRFDQGRVYVVTAAGRTRRYLADDMWAWIQGFAAAKESTNLPTPDRARHAQVRQLLTNPSLTDAIRIALRAAMEVDRVSVTEMEQRTGNTRKTIADALHFGPTKTLSLVRAETLMHALGRGWYVRATPSVTHPVASDTQGNAPTAAPAEPIGLTRARALLTCHDQGLVDWIAPTDPNVVIRAKTFDIGRGERVHEVAADALLPWLFGVIDAAGPAVADLLTD